MKIKQVFFLFLVLFLAGTLLVHGATDKELYEMGKTAYKSKRYSDAHDYFKRAVALNPTKAKYHYNLGLAARKLKSYGEAYEAFSKAKELDPQMKFTKKHQDFLNKLEEMRRRVPMESAPGRTDDSGAYAKGKAAYKNKQYQSAYNYFKQAAAAEPKKANRFYNLGLAARKLKNYQVAYASFLMAQQLDPQITFTKKKQDFYNKLEEARKKSSQKPQAAKSKPLSDYVYHEDLFKRGKELYKQRRYRDAYDKFKEAVGINRKNAKYQYNLGLAAYKLGLYIDAYDAFLSAEILDPNLNFTTKKGEFRKKMEKVIQYRREQGDEAQKKKDLWAPGVGRDHTQRSSGTFFTGRNILFMVFGFIALIIIINIFRSRSRSRSSGADVMDRINRAGAAGSDYRTGGAYDDRYRYKDKWWKRDKYKKRKKRKLWRVRRKGDRSYIDHDYRDRDIYDDDRDGYNKYAAGAVVTNALDRDGYETESSYYDAS